MRYASPFPEYLVTRYRASRERRTAEDDARDETLSAGQNPQAMIVTCCDSRVLIADVFGNEPGDFFIHRNIANLIPPHEPDGRSHGTSAAI